MDRRRTPEAGFALITVMLLAALLMVLLVGYFSLTHIELTTTKSSMNSVGGFYAAEAGLNIRARDIRATFLGYGLPIGTGPVQDGTECTGSNLGTGDHQCVTYSLQNRSVATYVVESASNPASIVVPRGEAFQNLNAQAYKYTVPAISINPSGTPEVELEMVFDNRLIPLFQFAAFYNKDLEIIPGQAMTLSGPVHTNGGLYITTGASLDVNGQVTTAEDLYLGRKISDSCATGAVSVLDPDALVSLPSCSVTRAQMTNADLVPWNGMVRIAAEELTVPGPQALDPTPGELYWDLADIRIVLDLDGGTPAIEIRNPDNSVDATGSSDLNACTGAVAYNDALFNFRENAWIRMLDTDVEVLLDCIHNNTLLVSGRALDDTTDGGLVFYLGVEGPNMNIVNDYGIRLFNGAEIASTALGAPAVQGLTVVTNQAAYIQGNYNIINKVPAAVLADSLNLLSNQWNDGNSNAALPSRDVSSSMALNAAFLAGTDTSGGIEGPAGQDLGLDNGGLDNFPRLHEDWSGQVLSYRGSFVSLNAPLHVDGSWSAQSYADPIRNWDYDTDFENAANLPPLSPRFVYLKQQLFVRDFGM